jgi:predicted O-methyltransferase YrrM
MTPIWHDIRKRQNHLLSSEGGPHRMKNHDVRSVVADLPHMTLEQAEKITTFITDKRVEAILELGFRHGVSTCYMAAALSE